MKNLCDFSPPVAKALVKVKQKPILSLSPRSLLHIRIQVIVPSGSTASLSLSTLQLNTLKTPASYINQCSYTKDSLNLGGRNLHC